MKDKEYGIVYVLSNPWMPGLVKIGKTTSSRLKARMQNLYGTGVPEQFKVEFSCSLGLDEYNEVEQMLHNAFANQRVNKNREFFQIEPERVIPILDFVQKSHKNYRETTAQLQAQIEQYQSELEEDSAHDGEDGDNNDIQQEITNKNLITIYCYSEKKFVDAVGEFDSITHKTTIKAGSRISYVCASCLSDAFVKERDNIIKHCENCKTFYLLKKDFTFNSPSTASTFCLGRPSNGWDDWKSVRNTKENREQGLVKTLGELGVR